MATEDIQYFIKTGADVNLVIGDASNNLWKIQTVGAQGTLNVQKNGSAAAINGVAPIVGKTASYTCLASDSGTTFISVSGAVVFTLPAVATSTGLHYKFMNQSATSMAITAPANTLCTFNNASATTVTWNTGSNIIGAGCEVWCNGTLWFTAPSGAGTMTVS